jgi:voltage-gated potassium channel
VSSRRIRPRSQASLDWYDQSTVWFWLAVSFVYLAVMLLQLFGHPSYRPWLNGLDWAMSGVFAVDYGLRFYMAPSRRAFVFHVWNLADLLVIFTPVIAMFTPVQWTGLLRIVRVVRLGVIARRVWDGSTRSFQRGQVKWIAIVAGGIVVLSWLTVWAQESQHPDSAIKTPLDALWWAIVTMFTVGYGDTYPHTTVGKVSATLLMFAGIALFGWVTAALASLFVESSSEKEARRQRDEMQAQMSEMAQQLERIEALLAGGDDAEDGTAQGI